MPFLLTTQQRQSTEGILQLNRVTSQSAGIAINA